MVGKFSHQICHRVADTFGNLDLCKGHHDLVRELADQKWWASSLTKSVTELVRELTHQKWWVSSLTKSVTELVRELTHQKWWVSSLTKSVTELPTLSATWTFAKATMIW